MIYGAIMGVAFVVVLWWLSGRPLRLSRPRLQNVLFAVTAVFAPLATEALGLGFGTGFVLVFVAAVIEYAWRRSRSQRAESAHQAVPPR
jgi:hypothetical protein